MAAGASRDAPPPLEFSNITRSLLYVANITVTFSSRQQILRENLFYDDSKQSYQFRAPGSGFRVASANSELQTPNSEPFLSS